MATKTYKPPTYPFTQPGNYTPVVQPTIFQNAGANNAANGAVGISGMLSNVTQDTEPLVPEGVASNRRSIQPSSPTVAPTQQFADGGTKADKKANTVMAGPATVKPWNKSAPAPKPVAVEVPVEREEVTWNPPTPVAVSADTEEYTGTPPDSPGPAIDNRVLEELIRRVLEGRPNDVLNATRDQTLGLLQDPTMGFNREEYVSRGIQQYDQNVSDANELLRRTLAPTMNTGQSRDELARFVLDNAFGRSVRDSELQGEALDTHSNMIYDALKQGRETAGAEDAAYSIDVEALTKGADASLGADTLATKQWGDYQDRILTREVEAGRIALEDRKILQQAYEFKSKLDWDKEATRLGLDDKERDRIWQSVENLRDREVELAKITESARQFDDELEWMQEAERRGWDHDLAKMAWQEAENQKDREHDEWMLEAEQEFAEKGLNLTAILSEIEYMLPEQQADVLNDLALRAGITWTDENGVVHQGLRPVPETEGDKLATISQTIISGGSVGGADAIRFANAVLSGNVPEGASVVTALPTITEWTKEGENRWKLTQAAKTLVSEGGYFVDPVSKRVYKIVGQHDNSDRHSAGSIQLKDIVTGTVYSYSNGWKDTPDNGGSITNSLPTAAYDATEEGAAGGAGTKVRRDLSPGSDPTEEEEVEAVTGTRKTPVRRSL